jgi:tetratricopeptide (TPR) repeat protein
MKKRVFLFLAAVAVLLAVACSNAVLILATYKIAYYTLAIRHDPNDADAYGRRGDVYLYKSDYDRAITTYEEALQFYPYNYHAKQGLENARRSRGR